MAGLSLPTEPQVNYNTGDMLRPKLLTIILTVVCVFSLICMSGPVSGEARRLVGEELSLGSVTVLLAVPSFTRREGFFSGAGEVECRLKLEVGNFSSNICTFSPRTDAVLMCLESQEEYPCLTEGAKQIIEPNQWGESRLLFTVPDELEHFLVKLVFHPTGGDETPPSVTCSFLFHREMLEMKQTIDSLDTSYRDPMGQFRLGKFYREDPAFLERAAACFRKAIEANETFYEAYKELSEVLINLKQYEKAIRLLEKSIERFPGQDDLWLALIDCYFKTGRNDQVETVLKNNPSLKTANPDICLSLSTIYLSNGQLEKAEILLSETLQEFPHQPFTTYLQLAAVYLKQRLPKKVEAVLQAGFDVHPVNWERLTETVNLLIRYNRSSQAISLLTKYMEDNVSEKTRALYEIGLIYLHYNRHKPARDHFLKVLELDPASLEAKFNLALIHSYSYEYQKAIRLWEEVEKAAPDSHPGKVARQNITILKKEMESRHGR